MPPKRSPKKPLKKPPQRDDSFVLSKEVQSLSVRELLQLLALTEENFFEDVASYLQLSESELREFVTLNAEATELKRAGNQLLAKSYDKELAAISLFEKGIDRVIAKQKKEKV